MGRSARIWAPRVFGGQVLGQAVAAGGRTLPEDSGVHHVNAQFLRPAAAHVPITFRVEPLRDGRTFGHRVVYAVQRDRPILFAVVSGHAPGVTARRSTRPSWSLDGMRPPPYGPAAH